MRICGRYCRLAFAVGLVLLAGHGRGEIIWPGTGVSVVAGPCAKVETGPDIVRVRADSAPANVWPAVYFTFPVDRDLSKAGIINVVVTNFTDRVLRISVKVKGKTVQGRLPDGWLDLPPHAVRMKELPLFAESWAFDRMPGLVGLKRNPGVGSVSSYSLDRVGSICVYLPAGTHEGEFGVKKVEIVPSTAGGNRLTVLNADSFFPWVDEFGQANFAEWPDKVHSCEELRTRADAEARELAEQPVGIPGSDRFGGWAAGPRLKATGFFRTEKVNGKWWLVDPDGHLFLSHGVCCGWDLDPTGISGREKYFEKLPPKNGVTREFWQHFTRPAFRNYYSKPENAPFWGFSFSAYDLFLKFGTDWKTRYDENTVRRMRSWGINTTSCSEGSLLKTPGHAPYVLGIWPTSRFIEGAKGYWRNLYDPFAPEFAVSCRKCVEAKRSLGTNEWCIGWTSNNELSWGVDGIVLARGVLSSKPDQPARIALEKMLAKWGTTAEMATDAQLRRLGEAVAEKYYSTVRAAVKAVAPNHLYLGDRNAQCNPEVFRMASRYLDVVTVNVYEHHPSVTLPADAEDKPLMVTEFHFGCYDTGYFYASLIPVRDQRERAECYRGYWRTVIDRPDYVGAHWFCWRDCPITGQLMEGANAQCGLVSTADIPYSELVRAIRDISAEMYVRRYGMSAIRGKSTR